MWKLKFTNSIEQSVGSWDYLHRSVIRDQICECSEVEVVLAWEMNVSTVGAFGLYSPPSLSLETARAAAVQLGGVDLRLEYADRS